ncbi:MAG: formylglycine-generating enzyme family protein [Nocardioides sp.]|uniref:formylglycine-generating enzyme family protein n=1 Tax=Nocardioides sp. TaxID=35761 RepID=UPI003F119FE7
MGAELTSMVELPGGTFTMGSVSHYPDEAPLRTRTVEPFSIESHPVTVRQFAAFVRETGYRTVAERPLEGSQFDHLPDAERVPGGLVFTPTSGPVALDNWRQWWRWVPGASWRQPYGPGSADPRRADHPVVQVSFEDASAYAAWAGRRLPTEAEHEFASRAGLEGATYGWGEELRPGGRLMANTWQGRFPYENTGALGWVGTSPVGTFPANDYGLVDLIGNVWEWTTTVYSADPTAEPVSACCAASVQAAGSAQRVLKGGSHLCAPEYCLRYRPAARSPQDEDSATSHIGFRCVS